MVVMYIPIGTTTLLRGLSDMRLKGDGCGDIGGSSRSNHWA